MLHSHKGDEFFFQFIHFRTHDVLAMVEDPVDAGFQLGTNDVLLSFQVNKR